jgi:GT2 family glycosyltransferase
MGNSINKSNDASMPSTPILVLGMHRSGTSAVARVIAALGAYPGAPGELLPAHAKDNPAGYWERTDLVIEHDRFLASVGYAWDRVAGFDPTALDRERVGALHKALRPIIDSLQGNGTPWLVKDPRLSILLPLWLPLIDSAACVVVVRDPREIAASLRATHRGVLTSQFPLLLWEKYLRSLLHGLRGRRALFVSYAALLADAQTQTTRLLHGLEALGAKGLSLPAASPAELIDDELHRSRGAEHIVLPPQQAALSEWLDAQTRETGPVMVEGYPDTPAPDALLREFEAAFDHHVEQGRAEGSRRVEEVERLHAKRERDYQTRTQEHVRQIEDAFAGERERLSSEIAAHKSDLALERARASDLTSELAAANDATHALRQQHAELSRHAAALSRSVDDLRTSLSWKITAPLRGVARALTLRISWNFEQTLYRLYYRLPGITHARKRAFVLWLHKHASWLTRKTMSYQMEQQSQSYVQAVPQSERTRRQPRMDKERADDVIQKMWRRPLISIVMPVYNVDARWLTLAVDSVREQYYPHWELCIADDASTKPETRAALDRLAQENDPRIKITRLPENVGIAIASNAALDLATGDYVGLLDHDDELTRDALLEVARTIIEEDPDLVYSDEDKTDESNQRSNPFYKPDYSPEFFLSNNYLCHFTVMRADVLKRIGGFRNGVDGAQDFDLFLRFTAAAPRVVHIPKVLYHWRMITGSTAAIASAKPYTWEAGRKALEHRIALTGTSARVENGPFPNTYRVRYTISGTPLVSIIIPFRDKPELLDVCVRSILTKTDYPHFEIIGIDNDSADPKTDATKHELAMLDPRIRFVDYDAPFNYSAITNFGAAQARGEHLLMLNNDTEVLSPEWLSSMLEHSQRPEIGVVGAKLLYPDDTIQHAGVIMDRTVVAMHPHQFLSREHPGYAARPHLLQNLCAVTFACAMTRRDVFEKLQGLNETDLAICYNDVDYCLRARELGYLVVFTPYALLRHFESKSRGMDESVERQARFKKELDYMRRRHAEILEKGDPYYNPNLSLGVQSGFHIDPHYAEELPR